MTPYEHEKELKEKIELYSKKVNETPYQRKDGKVNQWHSKFWAEFFSAKAELKGFQTGVELERKRILDLIDKKIEFTKNWDCSNIIKQNCKWNLEELKEQMIEGKNG